MKVLLINGSPHKQGNTFLALSEAAKTLEQQGIETEIVHIGVKPVRGCIACAQCKIKQLDRCVFDDDVCNRISEKLDDVDGLIVGSPVYYGQPNGSVLSLIQRMFFSAGAKVVNKPAAAVCVCRRGGATAAYQTMNMPFEMMNMPWLPRSTGTSCMVARKVRQRSTLRVCRPCERWPTTWPGY